MSLRAITFRSAAIAVACLPTAGCSWMLVTKPPPGRIRATTPLECTSSMAAPVIDTVEALLVAGAGVALLAEGLASKPSNPNSFIPDPCGSGGCVAAGAVLVGAALPSAFSAAYGYENVSDCRRLKEAQLSCSSGVEESCRSLRGWTPR